MIITQSNRIEITHLILGYDGYGISKGVGIFNLQTGKKLKKQLKGYTVGYYLSGRFLSMAFIKNLVYEYKEENLPF
jgi:hypothetical protein